METKNEDLVIGLRTLTKDDYLALRASMQEAYADWEGASLWGEAHINMLVEIFPEGQICVVVFNRIGLALGFLPSGFVKIAGERFTALSVNHPMGHYLEALHRTGFYYTFIGVAQVLAALLLLIPRTALLGALIYFPLILNICILTFSVRFEGSWVSSPLMVLANLYLLCWDYHRLKGIFPWGNSSPIPKQQL